MSSQPRTNIKLFDTKPSFCSMVLDENFCDVYIQNIPIELTKEGLQNLFVQAGPIERVKLLTNRLHDSKSNYGFVTFKNKSSALQALHKFNDFKLGKNRIRVKLAKPKEDTQSPKLEEYSISSRSLTNEDFNIDDWDASKTQQQEQQMLCSLSRASLNESNEVLMNTSINRNQIQLETTRRSQHMDMSRPYARRMVQRRTLSTVTNESKLSFKLKQHVDEEINKLSTQKILYEKDSRIKVDLLYVENPSHFYLQPDSTLKKAGELALSLDNCYRNDDFDESEMNLTENFQVGDLCACQIDGFWNRCKILAKNSNSYRVNTIDIGENFEVFKENIRRLKREFQNIECTKVRCALAGIKPYKANEWSLEAVEFLQKLALNTEEPLYARIVDIDRDNNAEQVCLVQLFLMNENNGVIDLMIDRKLAEKSLNFQLNTNDIINVSTKNILTRTAIERVSFGSPRTSLLDSLVSSKMFTISTITKDRTSVHNNGFALFKKRDLNEQRTYTPSTRLDICITSLESLKSFYVTVEEDSSRRSKLENLIQIYAHELLTNTSYHESLYLYMINCAQYDLVVVLCKREKSWKRAFISKISTMANSKWFLVRFIDDGRTQQVECPSLKRNDQDVLVTSVLNVLPFSATLVSIAPFSLHCCLNRTEQYDNIYKRAVNRQEYELYEDRLFEEFRDCFLNKNLKLNVVTFSKINKEIDYYIELFYKDENGNLCNCLDFIEAKLKNGEVQIIPIGSDKTDKNLIDKYLSNFNKSQLENSSSSLFEKSSRTVSNISLDKTSKPTNLAISTQSFKTSEVSVTKNYQFDILEENKSYEVYLISLIDFKNMFVVRKDKFNDLLQILDEINTQEFINDNTQYVSNADLLENGQLVLANYELDESYYRALILDTQLVINKIKVLFVDYGNVEYVELSKIRKFTNCNGISRAPFKINYCELSFNENIIRELAKNQELSTHVSSKLNQLLEQEVKIKVLQTRQPINDKGFGVNSYLPKYSIEMSFENNENDLLKFLSLDKIAQPEPTLRQIMDKTLSSGKNLLDDQFESNKIIIPQVDLRVEQTYLMKLSSFESAEEIFFQLDEDTERAERIEKYLNDPLKRGQLKKLVKTPSVGDFVLSNFGVLDLFYRARILDIKESSKFNVFYIDYGNFEEGVSIEALRQLDKNELCMQTAQLAYSMKLNDVELDAHNSDHDSIIQMILSMESINVKIISCVAKSDALTKTYVVELYDPNDSSICFNNKFSHKIDTLDLSGLRIGNELDAEYSWIESVDSPLYFHLENAFEQRANLQNELHAYFSMKVNQKSASHIQVGNYYGYYFCDEWCRVKVDEVTSDTIGIFFIDYGNTDKINESHSVNLKILPTQLKKYTRMAFPVNLSEPSEPAKKISSCLSNEQSTDIMQSFCIDEENNKLKLRLKIHSIEPLLVEVLNQKKESLNEKLKKPKLIYERLKYTELPKQDYIDETKKYRIYFNKFDEFYLFEENDVNEIQDKIGLLIDIMLVDSKLPSTKAYLDANIKPEIGDLVYGQDDQCWYRALITNINESFTLFELFFIDFGNYQDVSVDEILLPSDTSHLSLFKKYSPKAFKTKLYGLKGPFDEKSRDFLKNIVADNEFYVDYVKKQDILDIKVDRFLPTFEVRLKKCDDSIDVHEHLIINKIAKFDTLENIALQTKTPKEIQFYVNLLSIKKI